MKKTDADDPRIKRGKRLYLYPNKYQRKILDKWRCDLMQEWNFFVNIQKSLYDGSPFRPELKWREILVDILRHQYEQDHQIWLHGRAPGKKRAAKEARQGKEPQPPKPETVEKILRGKIGKDGDEPKLFGKEREMLALLARLKEVGRTKWLAGMPSHASQRVVSDLDLALKAMLREKRKRAAGKGLYTGFPKYKKFRYGDGSIYLANTQLTRLHVREGYVVLPNGLGKVKVLPEDRPRTWRNKKRVKHGGIRGRIRRWQADVAGGKLQGARIYRQGESWCMTLQYFLPRPEPLPGNGRIAGVKIAGSVPLTIYDGRIDKEIDLQKIEPRLEAQYRAAGQRMSRRLLAQKKRERHFIERLERAKENDPSLELRKKKFRLRRSRGFFNAAAQLADFATIERKRRDDLMHRRTTELVRKFELIAVQKMNVASLMRKRKKKGEAKEGAEAERHTSTKKMRKIMQSAAMAKWRQTIEYKANDCGRIISETETEFKDVQTCSVCGHENIKMRDGRQIFHCPNCGYQNDRRRNAARNEYKRAVAILKSDPGLAAKMSPALLENLRKLQNFEKIG